MTESQPHHAASPSGNPQITLAGKIPSGLLPADSIRFGVLPYPERLGEILELRHATYAAADKIPHDAHPIDLTDSRDPQASMVVAESAGRIIASVRIAPPMFGSFLYPDCGLRGPLSHLPPKSDLLETAWACIHPDYQGQGLFWHLAAHMLVTAEKCARPFLVGATTPELWSNWRRCGYQKTGVTLKRHGSGREYSVIVLDVAAVLAGKAIGTEFARALFPLLTAARAIELDSRRSMAI